MGRESEEALSVPEEFSNGGRGLFSGDIVVLKKEVQLAYRENPPERRGFLNRLYRKLYVAAAAVCISFCLLDAAGTTPEASAAMLTNAVQGLAQAADGFGSKPDGDEPFLFTFKSSEPPKPLGSKLLNLFSSPASIGKVVDGTEGGGGLGFFTEISRRNDHFVAGEIFPLVFYLNTKDSVFLVGHCENAGDWTPFCTAWLADKYKGAAFFVTSGHCIQGFSGEMAFWRPNRPVGVSTGKAVFFSSSEDPSQDIGVLVMPLPDESWGQMNPLAWRSDFLKEEALGALVFGYPSNHLFKVDGRYDSFPYAAETADISTRNCSAVGEGSTCLLPGTSVYPGASGSPVVTEGENHQPVVVGTVAFSEGVGGQGIFVPNNGRLERMMLEARSFVDGNPCFIGK